MLYDMRASYIRHGKFGYRDGRGLLSPKMTAVLFLISATLLYLSFRWGTPIGVNEAAVLYMP